MGGTVRVVDSHPDYNKCAQHAEGRTGTVSRSNFHSSHIAGGHQTYWSYHEP